jgi:hypothetical protein
VGRVRRQGPEPPSTYYYRQIYGCFFDDEYGLENIEKCGVNNICFETDYPHSDSTWPHSKRHGDQADGQPARRRRLQARARQRHRDARLDFDK